MTSYRPFKGNAYKPAYKLDRVFRYSGIGRNSIYRVTYHYMSTAGKFYPINMLSDGKDGLQYPLSYTYEEYRNFIRDRNSNYKVHTSTVIRRYVKSASKKDLEEFLGIRDPKYKSNFDLMLANFWKKSYDYQKEFDRVMVDRSGVSPLIDLMAFVNLELFKPFSLIAYKWNELLSEVMSMFLEEYRDEFNPYTSFSSEEYFYNCIKNATQRCYLGIKTKYGATIWEEIYRLSHRALVYDEHYRVLANDDVIDLYNINYLDPAIVYEYNKIKYYAESLEEQEYFKQPVTYIY